MSNGEECIELRADVFYGEMKMALNFFGLRFSDMGQMSVLVSGNTIKFNYRNGSVELRGEPMENTNEQSNSN